MEQDLSALSADAAELVRSNVNVLVAQGTEPALQAVLGATRTVPIVMMAANYDPFASGYVRSLARPDGNVTGVFLRQTELAEKQTELLWQAFPNRARLGILWDAISVDQFSAAERRAKIFGLQVHSLKLENRLMTSRRRFAPWRRPRRKRFSSCRARISSPRAPG